MVLSGFETVESRRERLILEQLPQVELIARRLQPDGVCLADLVSAGTIGLISAIDKFEAGHNAQLRTYAEHRIRGAILDSLRESSSSRPARQYARRIRIAVASLEQRLGRRALAEEVAEELGVPLEDYHRQRLECQCLHPESLEAQGPQRLEDVINSGGPWDHLEKEELGRMLNLAVLELPQRSRTVLELYYERGLNLREIALELGTSIPNVAKIKSGALEVLRRRLLAHWPRRGGVATALAPRRRVAATTRIYKTA